jgi:chloride channel protein, CIC family
MPRVATASKPEQLQGREYVRLILFAALIGIPAALLAAVFLAFINLLQDWLWTDLPKALGTTTPPWYLVLGLPVVGAAIVVAARTFLPGDGGHQPLKGLSTAPTPLANGPGVALAAIGTLGFGAVLGPEAPLIALGSFVGMIVTRFVKLDQRATGVISIAGSFSAISALFGGPLVAGMLLVEAGVGMGTAILPALLPGLVAAAVGYVLFIGLGTWGGLHEVGLAVPGLPPYTQTSFRDLLIGLAVGIAAGLVIAVVRMIGNRIDGLSGRRVPMAVLVPVGGLLVGVLALAARGLGANSQDVLFSGEAGVPDLVAQQSMKIVLVLLVAKALGYAISLGSGFRGGPVFPSIFVGVALGSVAQILFGISPTLAVAIGTAAGMAAMTRLLFAPLLFATLLVGSGGIDTVPAAVFASVGAWITTMALDKRASHRA